LSADDLDKSGIDDTKVEQILAKKPGITFNIQELVCSVLKDDSFITKLVPKICEFVCQKLEEKYVNLVNDVSRFSLTGHLFLMTREVIRTTWVLAFS
jgi:hypothetical protein